MKALPGASLVVLGELYKHLHGKKPKPRTTPRLGSNTSMHRGNGGVESLWEKEQKNMLRRTEQLL